MSDKDIKIILIDDNDASSELFELLLFRIGYANFQRVAHHSASCELLQGLQPDLIFVNLQCQKAADLQWLPLWAEASSNDKRRVPVILISSAAERGDLQRALQFNAFAYIIAPPSRQILQSKIAQAIQFRFGSYHV